MNDPFNLDDIAKSLGVDPTGGHKHSGREALMSGAANACPICQAQNINALKQELANLRLRDEQLVTELREIRGSMKTWISDAQEAIKIANNQEVVNAVIDRMIDYRGVDILVENVMKLLLPKDDQAKPEASVREEKT